MKPTKPSDLRGLSDGELLNQIKDNERALVDMRFKKAVGQLESTAVIRIIRRDIARLKTILRERELGKTA
ncbi:MAG: 50S ribosomal protein L29 [Bacteroidetes bacterium]|nr:50S ribosomal protein L29 [Bacteroidota bacterium]HVZ40260.1 50S ribosomal protein L29 [Candidatus Kapabacteria bacterium]